uniref:BOS complex subunit TMEM147 n=1 Tax=Myxine glutinosa TaxID=7769 RepID=UPI0035900715
MTLFHLGNCLALSFIPYVITYKCSGLAEYSAFWRCVQAGGIYVLVQLCKMLFLATFFPTWEGVTVGGFDAVGELMKATVEVADLCGLYVVMVRMAGRGELKVMVAGMGWATAELFTSRFVPLWVGARGMEFDWKFIQISLDSNISLVHHLVTAALVWLRSRYDLPHKVSTAVSFLLLLSIYRNFFSELVQWSFVHGGWAILGVRAAYTALQALVTLSLFVRVTA